MTDVVTDEAALARNGIQVISRAAAVLRALREDPNGLSLAQIAERVGLARSTVQRIVAALQEERLVFSAGSGDIRLGPEITALAQATTFNVVDLCRPLLMELSQKTGETADLSVLRGHQMIFLDQVSGSHRLRAVSAVGDIFPLTDTANGRAVLAAMTPKAAEQLALEELRKKGAEASWASLSLLLDEVRKTGVAYDLDEHTEGISAAGVAFCDRRGSLHAISVPVPTARFETQRSDVVSALETARAAAVRLLGT
jgi:DNA-binding IclR family transcriptional regulator